MIKVTDEHLEFLDNLRDGGEINMFGASPCVEDMFDVSSNDAKNILTTWMKTFTERHTE